MDNLNEMCPGDPNSFANTDEAIVKSAHLNLDVDFGKKILSGKVTLTVEKVNKEAHYIDLDTHNLIIDNVKDDESGQMLEYSWGKFDEIFGTKLRIKFPIVDEKQIDITINYSTSPNSSALQWLSPEQTSIKAHPYLFSQCQPIHCRSMIPCQDTPSVKIPYTAEITAPLNLTVLMSAIKQGEPIPQGNNKRLHKFEQSVPIPVYLIAIAVGDLESRKIGPRSHVWAEKDIVEAAAFEFAETENYLQIAEELCGPYVWGIYDLLVLPPSFPYGGMENPCLTFVTPTLLAGDRSLSSVIAHEISHSWTGNLVTNCNFEHFWLNEGFTVFLERKIKGRVFGENLRQFSAHLGFKSLIEDVNRIGQNNDLTSLVPNLKGIHPDDAFSSVPYEKGHSFLYYLEECIGRNDFETFFKAYIEKFKFKSITSDDFKSFICGYFPNNTKLSEVDWNMWFHTPGLFYFPKFDSSVGDCAIALSKKWIEFKDDNSFSKDDIRDFSAIQKIEFLECVFAAEKSIPVTVLQKMQDVYNFDAVKNSEIKFRWLRICLKNKWEEQIKNALSFVNQQGRMKFTRPIYRDLYEWEKARKQAISNFESHKSSMMHCSVQGIEKDLHLQ